MVSCVAAISRKVLELRFPQDPEGIQRGANGEAQSEADPFRRRVGGHRGRHHQDEEDFGRVSRIAVHIRETHYDLHVIFLRDF